MISKRKGGAMPAGFLSRTLGAVVGEREAEAPEDAPTTPAAPSPAPQGGQDGRNVRVSFFVAEDVIEGLRDAVDALSGPPHRLGLNAVVRDALARALDDLQRDHNDGRPFPKRPGNLRTGRVAHT